MADEHLPPDWEPAVTVSNRSGSYPMLIVCEHASNHIPKQFSDLGLDVGQLQSHVAWDPGARLVAAHLSQSLNAPLITSEISRLVYDCNRPFDDLSSIPEKSETTVIPGNARLAETERRQRFELCYQPFEEAVRKQLDDMSPSPALLTIHSFTPVYLGKKRDVEFGILHDSDRRFADALLQLAAAHLDLNIRRNEPYGVADGVTHTLKVHGVSSGILNAMLEIRNDLLKSHQQCVGIAEKLSRLVDEALARCVQRGTGSA